jgi:S-adenosylmethionine-dependent methyltransferase
MLGVVKEPSADLRQMCEAAAAANKVAVKLVEGTIETLSDVIGEQSFDLVCAHGLLMYLPDRANALDQLARRVGPGGQLSITFRNGHALAMRPGLRRDWTKALEAFGSRNYINELGVPAQADLIEDVTADLVAVGMKATTWYGVRIFNDSVATATPVPTNEDIGALLEAEDRAGRLDPYRWMASMIHLIATPAST